MPYPLSVEDKFWNYLVGHDELDLDLMPVLEHFAEHLPEERVFALAEEALLTGWERAADERTTKKGKKGKKRNKGRKGK